MQKMPELKPLRIPADPPHHSANVDWDHSSTAWTLDDAAYVSEPKSLKWPVISIARRFSLCKHAGTTVLPEGRIVSYIRTSSTASRNGFCFRHQSSVGSAADRNFYSIIYITPLSQIQFYVNVGGAYTLLKTGAYGGGFTLPINTWRKVRVTWWESGGVLYVRVEWWTGTEWTNVCDEFFHADNRWFDSEINRCGLWMSKSGGGTHYNWFDDTEVWGP